MESYRLTPGYWLPHPRLCAEATATVKLWKWLRISARERYQYTRQEEKTITRTDHEFAEYYQPDGTIHSGWETTPNPKTYASEDEQVVRSRFKFEMVAFCERGVPQPHRPTLAPAEVAFLYRYGIQDKQAAQGVACLSHHQPLL